MMNWLMLLAEDPIRQRLEGLRQGFNTRQTFAADFRGFLWFVVGVASILLVLVLFSRCRQRESVESIKTRPLRVFEKALRHLGVGLGDRVLLIWLSWHSKIVHPTAMLLSADLLETQAGKAADRLKPLAFMRYVRRRVDALASMAFASS